ncbi:hypothetical protein GCM10009557_66700 [Virgisporangium ochraceum]
MLAAVLAVSADLRLPPWVLPPAEQVPGDPAAYVGRYSSPAGTYEIVAADGGLDVTTIPKGMFVEIGEEPKTARYVPLGDDRFVGAEPDEGVHPQLVFIDDGRYLYNSRAMPRETPGEPG